jgi:hypothetical protein
VYLAEGAGVDCSRQCNQTIYNQSAPLPKGTLRRGAIRNRRVSLRFMKRMVRYRSMTTRRRLVAKAIAQVAQGFMAAFPDMRVTMDNVELQNEERFITGR